MKVNAGSARAGHVIELDGKVFKIGKDKTHKFYMSFKSAHFEENSKKHFSFFVKILFL